MVSPMNVTRLPDTDPPIPRGPTVEDLPATTHVLGKIEGDEHRMGQWPIDETGDRAHSRLHHGGHWRGTDRCLFGGSAGGVAAQGG